MVASNSAGEDGWWPDGSRRQCIYIGDGQTELSYMMEVQTLTHPSTIFVVAYVSAITLNWEDLGSIDNFRTGQKAHWARNAFC